MPVIFESTRGRVVQLPDPSAECQIQLYSLDPSIRFSTELSIVTRITFANSVNLQLLHTMGAHIYVYVFGDRAGTLNLSGLSFACPCDDFTVGAEQMYLWYKRNRASKRQLPVRLTLGLTTIEGIVVSGNEDVVDPSTSLTQWGINMTTFPEDD